MPDPVRQATGSSIGGWPTCCACACRCGERLDPVGEHEARCPCGLPATTSLASGGEQADAVALLRAAFRAAMLAAVDVIENPSVDVREAEREIPSQGTRS